MEIIRKKKKCHNTLVSTHIKNKEDKIKLTLKQDKSNKEDLSLLSIWTNYIILINRWAK